MKQLIITASRAGASTMAREFSFRKLVQTLAVVCLFSWAISVPAGPRQRVEPAIRLEPGQIVYVDSGNAFGGGVFVCDPIAGTVTPIAIGGLLRMPFAVTIDPITGLLLISDSGRIIAIDPGTGGQLLVADGNHRDLGWPCGMDRDVHGNTFLADLSKIVRLDGQTGELKVVASGGSFLCPLGVAVAHNGDIYVLNRSFPNEVIRIDARTGEQKVISRGGLLRAPQAMTIQGQFLYVTDVATPDCNFGIGRVLRIDRRTGEQSVVSEGGHLVCPVGIAVDAAGQLVVGDPYTINPASRDLYDGGIVRIDPVTGAQELLARGANGFVNPRGVAVVPQAYPRTNAGLRK